MTLQKDELRQREAEILSDAIRLRSRVTVQQAKYTPKLLSLRVLFS